jgi:hypothetical protein
MVPSTIADQSFYVLLRGQMHIISVVTKQPTFHIYLLLALELH